mmetsp:Transcript_14686/g.30307  ORF Transcript_14686/g.30307 Transcript_14686/m.30307 type:complete len:297 (+) Transcript_14686:1238-2128(+)
MMLLGCILAGRSTRWLCKKVELRSCPSLLGLWMSYPGRSQASHGGGVQSSKHGGSRKIWTGKLLLLQHHMRRGLLLLHHLQLRQGLWLLLLLGGRCRSRRRGCLLLLLLHRRGRILLLLLFHQMLMQLIDLLCQEHILQGQRVLKWQKREGSRGRSSGSCRLLLLNILWVSPSSSSATAVVAVIDCSRSRIRLLLLHQGRSILLLRLLNCRVGLLLLRVSACSCGGCASRWLQLLLRADVIWKGCQWGKQLLLRKRRPPGLLLLRLISRVVIAVAGILLIDASTFRTRVCFSGISR